MKSPLGLDATLPVSDLVHEALVLLWQKRQAVIRRFLPVLVLLALIDWLSSIFFDQQDYSLHLLFLALSVGLSVLMATACHRFTLLPEDDEVPVIRFWGRHEFRYLVRGVQILLIAAVMFFTVMFSLMLLLGGREQGALFASLVALFPAVYLWARLSVTLPEIALGQPSDLKRAWAFSRGNGGKLMLVVVIVPLLMTTPFVALYWSDDRVLNYVATFGVYLTTLISLVMLSLSYRFLLEFYIAENPVVGEIPVSRSDDQVDV